VIVNCTRKTELRSWQTLFTNLPPVLTFFEHSLAQGKLKTAAGYLLVLHAFESESFQVRDFARLLRSAADSEDWELCRELARFLVGIDASGQTLRAALAEADLTGGGGTGGLGVNGHHGNGNLSTLPYRQNGTGQRLSIATNLAQGDYFSLSRPS
jgi:hypothetical protein